MATSDPRAGRRARLASAQLYLVCQASGGLPSGEPRRLGELLASAIPGGVDVVQLREKTLDDEPLLALAGQARAQCERLGALFIVNDRPQLARESGADGVHLGQEDMPVAQAREVVGPELLIGLSTHAPREIDAADPALVDYIGVGPVHATPTKLGRRAVGLELVRYAAAHAPVPFFAIGGIDADNVEEVLAAGASRICVLRAVADAPEPGLAAHALRARIDREPLGDRAGEG
jgi:thiamine-phosphate pyrophosphorylase